MFVVLAVGVVVAGLGPADLVTTKDHRYSLRDEQGGQQVANLPPAKGEDARVVGRAFNAAVPRAVVVAAVPVGLAVCVVVFDVVRHQVGEGEAVMGGDEVDAGRRSPAGRLVQVGAPGQAF